MLKGQKKHIDKEQGKIKHEAPRSVNYRATQNKNNIGTTAFERSVVYTTVGFKGLSLYFILGPDIILNNKTCLVYELQLIISVSCTFVKSERFFTIISEHDFFFFQRKPKGCKTSHLLF